MDRALNGRIFCRSAGKRLVVCVLAVVGSRTSSLAIAAVLHTLHLSILVLLVLTDTPSFLLLLLVYLVQTTAATRCHPVGDRRRHHHLVRDLLRRND